MSATEFHEVEELAVVMKEQFAWECVLEPFEIGALCRSICTCALVIARLTGSTGPIYEASDEIGKAADRRDEKTIREWPFRHLEWEDVIVYPRDRLAAMRALMWALANYFAVKGQ